MRSLPGTPPTLAKKYGGVSATSGWGWSLFKVISSQNMNKTGALWLGGGGGAWSLDIKQILWRCDGDGGGGGRILKTIAFKLVKWVPGEVGRNMGHIAIIWVRSMQMQVSRNNFAPQGCVHCSGEVERETTWRLPATLKSWHSSICSKRVACDPPQGVGLYWSNSCLAGVRKPNPTDLHVRQANTERNWARGGGNSPLASTKNQWWISDPFKTQNLNSRQKC